MNRELELREQMLKHATCIHAALDAAKSELETLRSWVAAAKAEKQAAMAMIEPVIEELIKHERMDPRVRKTAADEMSTYPGALGLLKKAADVRNLARPTPVGHPAIDPHTGQVKQGSYGADNITPFVGERRAGEGVAERRFREQLLGQ